MRVPKVIDMIQRTLIFLGFLASRSYWFLEFYTTSLKKMLRAWQAKNMTTKTIYNKNRSIPVRFNLERKISVLRFMYKKTVYVVVQFCP